MSQENFNSLYEWAEKARVEFAVAYDLDGLKKIEAEIVSSLDGFQSLAEKEKYWRVFSIGAFLGQCMVVNLNGEWFQTGDGIGIKLERQGIWTDPFGKVSKLFRKDGAAGSIVSFYEMTRDFAVVSHDEPEGQ